MLKIIGAQQSTRRSVAKPVTLSDLKCGQAKYEADGRNRLFDGGGLYLEIMPSGRPKWRLKYNSAE
ncbi:Arm DNA-binding domain-containing protein [Paraburkholderia xenovorans]|uniref:Arm DNA-binding domain-containing protein n=1 Tax=Paraburkholderia xenovorans TaxID=36873 RepID=UPI0038BA083D